MELSESLHLWPVQMYGKLVQLCRFCFVTYFVESIVLLIMRNLIFSKLASKFCMNVFASLCFQPRIDDKHPKWLHLRIRPSSIPFLDPTKTSDGKVKPKALVDGRWTLAFRDEESCKTALSMIVEETDLQSNEVEKRLKPLLDLENALGLSDIFQHKTSSLTESFAPNN